MAEHQGNAYANVTMVHNWWEDRQLPTRQDLTTTDRCFSLDSGYIPDDPDHLATTKRAAEHATKTTAAPAKVVKPNLYNQNNLESRLDMYGRPDKMHYTLGQVVDKDISKVSPDTYTTTTKHFFEDKPAADTTAKPEYFTTDTTHRITQNLQRDIWAQPEKGLRQTAGAKGARGEMSRNPNEGGNPYGVKVFVDEYAQWQNKLAGMPLSESVKRATTHYF